MKSLYRKYRPLKLENVVGQEQVTGPLQSSLKQGRISHAYLFVGPRGCGKTSVARILAHEVNGFKYEIEDDYVDIIEIDGASNRGIDNIRELREKVMVTPTSGKYKVYIIDEVHMLTKEAFNALLKTLEEPPEHAIFIMATTDAYKVPVTITSRAQTYTFKLADAETMFQHLKKICAAEKIKITDEALRVIVKRGGGSFRDSLSLLDQISTLSRDEITKDMVISAMGLPQDEKIAELLNGYTAGDIVKITTLLKDLLASGVKAETLAEEMIAAIVTEPKPELLPLLAKLPEVRSPFAEARLLAALTALATAKPIFSTSGLESLRTSYAGQPAEPSLRDEPVGGVRNIRSQSFKSKNDIKKIGLATGANTSTSFNWNDFVDEVKELNGAVHSQLIKCEYEFANGELNIYPDKRIVKSILSRDNNKRILIDAAGDNVKITIHDENDNPISSKKDEILSKISDIMGGEVQNDGGESPF